MIEFWPKFWQKQFAEVSGVDSTPAAIINQPGYLVNNEPDRNTLEQEILLSGGQGDYGLDQGKYGLYIRPTALPGLPLKGRRPYYYGPGREGVKCKIVCVF